MSSYQILEALILASALIGSLWLALRKGAPKLSQGLGALACKAGMNEQLSARIFGAAAACSTGCGSCNGCEKPAANSSARLHFQRKA